MDIVALMGSVQLNPVEPKGDPPSHLSWADNMEKDEQFTNPSIQATSLLPLAAMVLRSPGASDKPNKSPSHTDQALVKYVGNFRTNRYNQTPLAHSLRYTRAPRGNQSKIKSLIQPGDPINTLRQPSPLINRKGT